MVELPRKNQLTALNAIVSKPHLLGWLIWVRAAQQMPSRWLEHASVLQDISGLLTFYLAYFFFLLRIFVLKMAKSLLNLTATEVAYALNLHLFGVSLIRHAYLKVHSRLKSLLKSLLKRASLLAKNDLVKVSFINKH